MPGTGGWETAGRTPGAKSPVGEAVRGVWATGTWCAMGNNMAGQEGFPEEVTLEP